MTPAQNKKLLEKARVGMLDPIEQMVLAQEFDLAIKMALRLERSLHELIKETEK